MRTTGSMLGDQIARARAQGLAAMANWNALASGSARRMAGFATDAIAIAHGGYTRVATPHRLPIPIPPRLSNDGDVQGFSRDGAHLTDPPPSGAGSSADDQRDAPASLASCGPNRFTSNRALNTQSAEQFGVLELGTSDPGLPLHPPFAGPHSRDGRRRKHHHRPPHHGSRR